MPVLNALREQLGCEPLLSATHIVVAYSGGVDSHVLLHALHSIWQETQLNFQLSVIHIHHGLSKHADQWQAHCQQVCGELSLTFQTANIAVEALPRHSIEALAREARYAKLVELAPAHSQVVLGQHQDDQVETFLLQLKRGAGPKGLSGMSRAWVAPSPLSSDKQVGFYRPLLDIRQQAILNYAQQHELNWCEDESNQNTAIERNFLRHDVLPVLQKRWPEFAKSVSRSASLCAEQQGLLEAVSAEKLVQITTANDALIISSLLELSEAWQRQLVRTWLSQQNIQSPSQVVLQKLKAELFEAAEDANPIIQWQNWQFRRFNQQLYVVPVSETLSGTLIHWKGEKKLSLPQNLGQLIFAEKSTEQVIHLDKSAGNISIRFGGYTDSFKPWGELHSKPLKQWFKLWKVPSWQRNKVAIVLQNAEIKGVLLNSKLIVGTPTNPLTNTSVFVSYSQVDVVIPSSG